MERFRSRAPMRFFSESEIEELKNKVARFLQDRGVELQHVGVQKKLAAMGARVDASGHRIRFPVTFQEQALRSLPAAFCLGTPAGSDLPLPHPDGGFYFCTGTGGRGYLDPETGRYRPLLHADVETWARLAGALDQVDLCAFPTPTDVPPETVDVHSLNILLQSTTKHVWVQPHTEQTLPYLFELCAARAGGTGQLQDRPLASVIACSLTPFRFKPMDIEVILQACAYGLPIHASSLPVIGGTSPITTVGTVLVAAIEILAMVIIIQSIRQGHPVFALATEPGGHFLETDNTLRHCREAFQPQLFLRRSRDAWSREGGSTLIELARERFRHLRAGGKEPQIPAEQIREMERIVAAADRALAQGTR